MLGTIVNSAAIVAGALIGLLLKKGLPEKMSDTLMKGTGLCTLFLGVSGSLKGENSLILIISIVAGIIIGEGVDLEDKLERLGKWVEQRIQAIAEQKNGGKISIAEGFVSASLLFCVGAMAVLGSLQSGLAGEHEILYNKAVLDFVIAIVFTTTLGFGVALSAVSVFVYQGTITLLAQWLSPLLTDRVVNEMTCVGSVILIGLGLNLMGAANLRVMNFVPAVFLPILLCYFI